MKTGCLAEPTNYPLKLELVAQNHQGLAERINEVLTRHGVTILNLDSTCSSAPMSGESLFRARIDTLVPVALSGEALAAQLELLTHELMVDIDTLPVS